MKIVYAGTPEYAVKPLEALLSLDIAEVVAVVTQEDKPVGRKGILTPPPVKTVAEKHGIPVLQFAKIREHIDEIQSLGADIMITCAYGQLLTQPILDAFPLGIFNLHASLLPLYRGASPIQSAVLQGDAVTGVTVMKTELGMDTGAILCAESLEIGRYETAGELSERLSELSAEVVVKAVKMLLNGNYTLVEQEHERATKVRKIAKEDALLDFNLPCKTVVDTVRGMNPSPVAYTTLNGKTLNVYRAEYSDVCEDAEAGTVVLAHAKQGLIVRCQDGCVKITELQIAGGKKMRASDFVNGKKIAVGDQLGKSV